MVTNIDHDHPPSPVAAASELSCSSLFSVSGFAGVNLGSTRMTTTMLMMMPSRWLRQVLHSVCTQGTFNIELQVKCWHSFFPFQLIQTPDLMVDDPGYVLVMKY
jgi:hypothetical protein